MIEIGSKLANTIQCVLAAIWLIFLTGLLMGCSSHKHVLRPVHMMLGDKCLGVAYCVNEPEKINPYWGWDDGPCKEVGDE